MKTRYWLDRNRRLSHFRCASLLLLAWPAAVAISSSPASACLFGRLFGRLFPDLFFNFTAPVAREPGTQNTIEQICQKKHCRHPFVIHHGEDEDENDRQKPRNRFFRFPVQRLEARILKPAKHHE